MAYTKTTWNCGDEISAERMNNIEDGIEEALAGGGGDVGYECIESSTTLYDGSIVTEDIGDWAEGEAEGASYSSAINHIKATFDGTEYELDANDSISPTYVGFGAEYDENIGNYDFSEIPFNITLDCSDNGIFVVFFTANAGTYSLTIEAPTTSITTTECFEKAVKKIASPITHVADVDVMFTLDNETVESGDCPPLHPSAYIDSKTQEEIASLPDCDFCIVYSAGSPATSGDNAASALKSFFAVPDAISVEIAALESGTIDGTFMLMSVGFFKFASAE